MSTTVQQRAAEIHDEQEVQTMQNEDTKVVMTQSGSFTPVKVKRGVYPATYKSVRSYDFIDKNTKEERPSFIHAFEISDGPEKGKVLEFITSKKFNEKTKLYAMVKAIDEKMLPKIGETLDLSSFFGWKVSILVDDRGEGDKLQSYIKEVLPA